MGLEKLEPMGTFIPESEWEGTMPRSKKIRNVAIGALVICVVLLQGLFYGGINHYRDAYNQMATEAATLHSEVVAVRNRNQSLDKAVAELSDANTHLLAFIDSMGTPPTEIKYVIKTETKLVPADPVVIMPDLPSHYTYKLTDKIPVAEFDVDGEQYKFTTHELSFKNSLIVGENKSAVLLQVSSSADGIWHEVPTELQVINTSIEDRYPTIRPGIALGIASTINPMNIETLLPQGVIAFPTFHIAKRLDIMTPAIGVGITPHLSLYLGSWNMGGPLPIVEDLWLSAGPSLDMYLQPGATIAITTSL